MSFLDSYKILSDGNESPAVYHEWAALSAMSSILSRRVWFDQNVFKVYPNMYVLLVGKAGIKKTTAMNIAKGLIRAVTPPIPIAPASITKEAMTQFMAEDKSPCRKACKIVDEVYEYTHLSLFCNEFVTLLEAGGNAPGMVLFLTEIWDSPKFEVMTKNRGSDYITNPFLSLLGCLTTETVGNLLATKIVSSGFSRRCIFVYSEDYGTPIPRPQVTDEQKDAWDYCLARAKELQCVGGEFKMDRSAMDWWDTFYVKEHELKAREEDPAKERYLNGKMEYVIKLAMMICLSEKNSLLLTDEHLMKAAKKLEVIEPNMFRLFQGSGRNELSPIAVEIERVIVAAGQPVMKKAIYAQFYNQARPEEIDSILSHLVRVDKIKQADKTVNATVVQMFTKP